ncbi:osteopetrosis-associated transmembrane protein 1-like [Patiria miniata]|uniref:Osteopetrosis-associated transmembrane protein 1 n=1 Tax=Patiria miniata TaxID=46514 RepID=A0A913ZB49_PATMI|nr:osteopetrosis-associated transmembrane protein 1-like [Patiria miniata]
MRHSNTKMSIIFVVLLGFLATHTCSADKNPVPVPVVTDRNDFVSNITESENLEFTSTGKGTPTGHAGTSAERTTAVVTDDGFLFPDGKSTYARFIPALSCDCRRLMEEYARFSSSFMHCALIHAKPLLVCEMCVAKYKDADKKFREIEKSTCDSSLLSSDRVQILRETHEFVKKLWVKGNCGNCFKDMKNCSGSHNEDCQVTEKVSKFQKYNNETLDCFAAINDHDVCKNCSEIYGTLSKFYASMGNVEEICMDCVELMNSTRKEWSTIYNCTRIRRDIVSIVAISVFFCSLPLFFYVGSKMHTAKTEHKLVKQNRLIKSNQRPRPKVAALPAHREAYLTNDSSCNSI